MGGGPVSPGRRDEVVLITGCSDGGIGAAMAHEFCDNGFTVVATSRSLSTMRRSFSEPKRGAKGEGEVGEEGEGERGEGGPHHMEFLELDLLSPESIREAVASVMAMFGRIDILVNNAAVPCTGPIAEVPIEVFDTVYRTNCLGPIMLIQAVVPHMVAKGKGKIVNVGSIVAFATSPFSGVYGASKVALHASTDALRLELRPFGIDVMLLVPGGVVTGLATKAVDSLQSNLSALQIFKPYQEYLVQRAMLSHHPKSTPAPLFAKKAVRAILSTQTPATYVYGFLSGIFRILFHCPYWIRDWWFNSKLPKGIILKKRV